MATNNQSDAPISWRGEHGFFISGTDHEDDTIRIPASHRKDEALYKLILPTLCITYADMKFANDVGGVQLNYPDSIIYGRKYFDPPVVLTGDKEIERFTWIRGAEKVTIGPEKTVVEFRSWRDLEIPKLRIRHKTKIESLLNFTDVEIAVTQPFVVKVLQYADGRHVGGINVTKRHPNWKPEPEGEEFDLLVRLIDGETRNAIPEAPVNLYTWNEEKGQFVPEATYYTNGMGIVDVQGLRCSSKKLLEVGELPWLPQAWRFRPLPDQKVKKFFRLWKHKKTTAPFVWRVGASIELLAKLSGSEEKEILKLNDISSEREINSGDEILIYHFQTHHHVEVGDTLESLAEYFSYRTVDELAKANGLDAPKNIHPDQKILLPGWMFFQAGEDDIFVKFDELFNLPKGWTRPARRVLHDNPERVYANEIIAVPTTDFIREHELKGVGK